MNRLVLAAAVAASATLPGAEGVRMEPCGNAEVVTVQAPPGYNAWPMIQAAGERVVCAYSRGAAHNTHEGRRDAYARTSLDGGRTWGPETCIVGTPAIGEAAEGRGTDENGALLFWVGRFGANGGHDLYRTTDGVTFEKIASLPAKSLSPMPIQVMDVFRIPGKGLASPWFAGNYRNPESGHSWGLLVSADNGRTWTQRTVEGDLAKRDWPTELSAVSLGGGRILVLARSEGAGAAQDAQPGLLREVLGLRVAAAPPGEERAERRGVAADERLHRVGVARALVAAQERFVGGAGGRVGHGCALYNERAAADIVPRKKVFGAHNIGGPASVSKAPGRSGVRFSNPTRKDPT